MNSTRDQSQRWSFEELNCPPIDSFLYIGIHGAHSFDIGGGRLFLRWHNSFESPASIKSAFIRFTAVHDLGVPMRIRIWGSTKYNQPQITDWGDFDILPRTKAYVDFYCGRMMNGASVTIDVTPILREMLGLELIKTGAWIGFKFDPQTILYVGGRHFAKFDPATDIGPDLHISEWLPDPAPDEPPPDPGIPQPTPGPILPPAPCPPPIPPTRAVILRDTLTWGLNRAHVNAQTDEPCTLKLLWTDVPPEEHKYSEIVRGVGTRADKKFCFVQWNVIDEENPNESHWHDFCWPDWHDGDKRFYRFVFLFGGVEGKPNTAFKWDTYPGDAAWFVPDAESLPILPPWNLDPDGLPCFGPTLILFETWSQCGIIPIFFELSFTEPWG